MRLNLDEHNEDMDEMLHVVGSQNGARKKLEI